MRILFVTLGESVHAARWIQQLQGQEWDIHVFPHNAHDRVHSKLQNLTYHSLVRQARVDVPESVRQTGLIWPLHRGRARTTDALQRFEYLKQPARLARMIRTLKPDIIHSLEMQRCGYLTLASRKELNGNSLPPWIYSSWGSDIYFFGRLPEHEPRIREVLATCDYYIADCNRDIALAREFGLRGEVLGVFPASGGFDLPRLRRLPSTSPVSSRRVIAVKGYQNEEWGGRALNALRALRLCATQVSGYEVVIYSASEEIRVAAMSVAKETAINLRILPPNPNEEIIKLFGTARISIGIGITDGSPISLLEAMTMGAFPIQSDTVSTGEWIRNGENGLLVTPEDPKAIATAIQRALASDELVDRAAALNSLIADERLDQEFIRPQVIELYKKVAKSKEQRAKSKALCS